MKSYFLVVCFLAFFSLPVFSQTKNENIFSTEQSLKDLEIRLVRVEEGQKNIERNLQELKAETKDLRNEMREEFRSLRSDSNTMFSVLIGGMLTIVFLIFWDRRTFLRPVVNELESTAKDTKAIVNVLRDFAKQEPKMFEAMKKETLL